MILFVGESARPSKGERFGVDIMTHINNLHVPGIFSQFGALSQKMRNGILTGYTFLNLKDKLKSLKLAGTNSPQSISVQGSPLDKFLKGAVPSVNNLPENSKPLNSTQLVRAK